MNLKVREISFAQKEMLLSFVDADGRVAADNISSFGSDETEDLYFEPQCVLRPNSAQQISKIAAYCNSQHIPITVRGAGTGLSGAALPVQGGLVLSTDRLNRIVEIDAALMQATVEPGVVNEAFQQALAPFGLFYPPDPASKGSCTLGGNIAHSSGGPRAVKYGGTKEYILNLEVVLANGETIWTGANTLKNSAGYNLTQLMIGSEGTLGIVTKAIVKLISLPTVRMLLVADFLTAEFATSLVPELLSGGIAPSAVEYMDATAFAFSAAHLGTKSTMEPAAQSRLMVEVDGFAQTEVMERALLASEVLSKQCMGEVLFAEATHQQEALWQIRRNIGHAVRANSAYREEDVCVPRTALPEVLQKVHELEAAFGFRAICYGHAGDGNIHINILRDELTEAQWQKIADEAIAQLFEKVAELKGTLSGEHGIGWVQKRYMPIFFPAHHLSLMHNLKLVFDPNSILNPHKILPNE